MKLCECGCGTAVKNHWVKGHNPVGKQNLKHGLIRTPTYRSWESMKARCTNPRHHEYATYGAVGVSVHPTWLLSFEEFLKDVGLRPLGKTLDRYPDPNGDYVPNNVRWATPLEQRLNWRPSLRFFGKGVYFEKDRQQWVARLSKKWIGRFDTESEALLARQAAVKEALG